LTEELMRILDTETAFSVLVLGAATGADGPGRVVTYVMKRVGKLRIPATIVPGNMSDDAIDAIS
jgi:hypothetical protein